MPTEISMMRIAEVGRSLDADIPLLPGGIRVQMQGSTMVIREGEKVVFTMKTVQVVDRNLMLDYPKTADGENERGWGILGMLIALYYGQSKRCTAVILASGLEHTSRSLHFWAKFGISSASGADLYTALGKGITWVVNNCGHPDTLTTFVLRDRKVAASSSSSASTPTPRRRLSLPG